MIALQTSDRFTQADGALYIDFAEGLTGTLWAFVLPHNVLSLDV